MNASVTSYYWSRLGDPRNVLDLGCGTGSLGAGRPPDCTVHGLEIDPDRVSRMQGYASAAVWDLDADRPLPFDDGMFDAVVVKDILEHLQKPWVTLREVHRVLRPGGIVLGSVICHRSRRLWADYTHVRGFTERTARGLFEDAGFRVQSVSRMGPVPLASRLRLLRFVPYLLRVPPFDWLWTSSYEVVATRPEL